MPTAVFYWNTSPRNQVVKSLTKNSADRTFHYKDDTDRLNPVITIARTFSMDNYNYVRIYDSNVGFYRYYYVEDIEYSQQHYILHLHEDVLMTYAADIDRTTCIVSKNQYKEMQNLYLNDDRMKLENRTRTLTFPFDHGFKFQGSKVSEFILTVNGGGIQ